jgi:hypothetical protein
MMRIKPELYRKAVLQLPGKHRPQFTLGKVEYQKWLVEANIPSDLIQFLVQNALEAHAPFLDCGGIMTPEDIMMTNTRENALLSSGLLQVGSAINGDPIVIDFTVVLGQTGYVSHDALWDPPGLSDPRTYFAPSARSIGEFLHGLTSDDDFPIDYDSATEINTLYETPD